MPLNNFLVDGLVKLLFQNLAIANVGDASGLQPSASAGVFYISLHSSDPGVSGNQTTSEVSYTSYARVSVVRTTSGWDFASHEVNLHATLSFPTCTGGTATAAYAGIGTDASGAGNLLWSGPISPTISVSNGITPQLTTGSIALFS